jgi:magnesium-transporting ATPase (P-type)
MLMPLLFVVGVSMLKDAFEDYGRAKQDNIENDLMVEACARGQNKFAQVKSKDILVGSIVKVKEN